MTGYFLQAFIYLLAAVIAVPIAKRLGLGSVLGYSIAGVVIGPIIGLVGEETTTIQHFAEFGVVMMLFLVGLELEPKMLWHEKPSYGARRLTSRRHNGHCNGYCIVLRATLDDRSHHWLDLRAFALPRLFFKRLMRKGYQRQKAVRMLSRSYYSEDIAVIPMLAFIPLLALPELVALAESAAQKTAAHHDELSLVAGLPSWAYGLVITASIAIVVVGDII